VPLALQVLFFFRVIASIVIVLLLIPLIWILATPFILIGAAFAKEHYIPTVTEAYRKTAEIWSNWGIILIDI